MNQTARRAEMMLQDLQKRARHVLDVGEIAMQSAKIQWQVFKKQLPALATKKDVQALNEQLISLNRRVGELNKKLIRTAKRPLKNYSEPHPNT